MKLTIVTATESTLENLNDLSNRVQMNTKDPSEIVIVKKMKLQNTVGKHITTVARIRRE